VAQRLSSFAEHAFVHPSMKTSDGTRSLARNEALFVAVAYNIMVHYFNKSSSGNKFDTYCNRRQGRSFACFSSLKRIINCCCCC